MIYRNQSIKHFEMRNFACLFLMLILMPLIGLSQEAQFPIVKGFGGIYEIEGVELPMKGMDGEFRIVIDLKTAPDDYSALNKGLNNVARMMNLHGLAGVSIDKLKVVVVGHGLATQCLLTNEGYQRKNGVDNPNLALIDALEEAGAEIRICGQSLIGRAFPQSEVYEKVDIRLSMLTEVTRLVRDGYQLLVFD
jgi:intracellular sulfur oxidation DsrE/DsrF family protein